ncbi:MAG TPA: site-specific integrase [Longimicrobiales bacterium]|nr:site-specific integrase [Longimicrobiales bacterium]
MSQTKRRKRTWTVTHGGIRLRLFRRPRSPYVWAEYRHPDGHRERFSLNAETKAAAEAVALEQAERLDRERVMGSGHRRAALTFGQLRALFVAHRGPLLSDARRAVVRRTLDLWAAHLEPSGRTFRLEDLGGHQVETYAAAREAGTVRTEDPRASRTGVRAGTIANEVRDLVTVLRWAMRFRQGGQPLLERNPLEGVPVPAERNPRRPRANRDRIDQLLEVALRVDPAGQFELMLRLAIGTGRRINAIRHLRASDVLMGTDQVRAGLDRIGWDGTWSDHWPAAILWRAENDKTGRDWIAPVPEELASKVNDYLRRTGAIGEAWVFPYRRRPDEPVPQNAADWWLRQAEKAAGLERQARGGWHAFRRAWATARKMFPMADVMQAGGWVDARSLQRAYSQADAATIRKVAEG